MQFIDTHAHLTSQELLPQLDEILRRAQEAQLCHIVNICTDPCSLKEGLYLEKKHPWIRNAGATTPHDVEKEGEIHFPLFEQAAREGKLIAIGETGLDYYYEHSNRGVQQQFLARYVKLAQECNLPVIFHCRDAFSDLFLNTPRDLRAVLHCFTGTTEEAKEAVSRGWMISFSGIATFKKSEALRETAKQVPLEHLLLETDAPYLAPLSKRGRLNEPAYLVETACCLAAIKQISLEEIAEITLQNALRLFSF